MSSYQKLLVSSQQKLLKALRHLDYSHNKIKSLPIDPGFEGTLRDFVNQGEKLGLIEDARAWMGIRELRNITSHDYSEEDLTQFFARLKTEAPRLLQIKEKLHALNH